MMKWPLLKCPFCGGTLRNSDVLPGKPLLCPACGAKLQPARGQLRLSALVALCLSIAFAYVLGIRGPWLILAVVLFWFPVGIVWEFIFARIVPPRFEAYVPKDYNGSLFKD
jgi:hypothetical protein